MDDPLVSVVLPTYNRLQLLRVAVESVLAQTFAGWELIVVDDGSDDGTPEYLAALAEADARVRPVLLERAANPARARNRGVERARGRWVAFLDSDDAWHPEKLRRHLDAHRARPEVRWSYSGHALMDPAGTPLPDERFAPWHPHQGRIHRALLTHDAMVAMPSIFVERALLDEIGGFDESLPFCQDFDLELRLAAAAECVVVPGPMVRIRLHSTSWTHRRLEVDELFIRVYRKQLEMRPEPAVARICRRQQAFYALSAARKHRARGNVAAALRSVAFALRLHPLSTGPWRVLARWVVDGARGVVCPRAA